MYGWQNDIVNFVKLKNAFLYCVEPINPLSTSSAFKINITVTNVSIPFGYNHDILWHFEAGCRGVLGYSRLPFSSCSIAAFLILLLKMTLT